MRNDTRPGKKRAAPPPLIARLLDADAYPHAMGEPAWVETHISWVVLTGRYAYKIKKPVALGFLDFSTLALRRKACRDELRLNRRFAPQVYVDVVPIAGPLEQARVLGDGAPIEYAVRMHQFAQADQLDRLLEAGRLDATDIARAAVRIAHLHEGLPVAGPRSGRGGPAGIRHSVEQTLAALAPLVAGAAQQHDALREVQAWCRRCFERLEPAFAERHRGGFVRECHGDLHLGNLVRLDGEVVPFDCIEFSAELRWIDVVNDIAFLMMDLLYREQAPLAFGLINSYLETCGDYAGVAVLRYYLVYRATVRALVARLRARQLAAAASARAQADAAAHLQLARRLAAPPPPLLLLMHGLSGSGKTHVSGELMQRWPAIRVRSDVERKRLLGLAATQSTQSRVGADAYSAAMGEATYARLLDAAHAILRGGFSVIIDAASLQHRQRERFRALATALGVPCVIVACTAPEAELRRRLGARAARGSDASEADAAVLDAQLRTAEPLDAVERAAAVHVDPVADIDAIVAALREIASHDPVD